MYNDSRPNKYGFGENEIETVNELESYNSNNYMRNNNESFKRN